MCMTCGCGSGETRIEGTGASGEHLHTHADGTVHSHAHGHGHEHAHDHGHDHSPSPANSDAAQAMHFGLGAAGVTAPGMTQTRLVQIERDILAKNDGHAQRNRDALAAQGVFALNLVSSPGSGKTTLLVRTIELLQGRLPVAVVEGDQQTSHDADRIRATGAPALQINTGKGCHLDAAMVETALARLAPAEDSVLMIENVGNLVCPAGFDLGEAHKVVVLSVTEGEDKPLKYPDMFHVASLMLLKVIRTNLLWLVVVISLAVMSAAIPVLGNTRSVVIVIGLIILITLKYFRRLSPRLVVIWLGISLTLISILTELRTENQRLTVERDNIVETILASGNGLDSYRSALIMELVPENAPYQYGKTYMGVISLAIPRAVWPTKPNTAVGPWVKAEVFGVPNVRNNGWPPGIVAEGYLNFSYIGVLVMPFLYGMFLRVFYNTARPLLGRSVLGTVVYASSLYPLCFSGLSNNIALGLVAWLYAIVPMIIFAALIWKKPVPVRAGQRPPAAAAATSRSPNYPARHVN